MRPRTRRSLLPHVLAAGAAALLAGSLLAPAQARPAAGELRVLPYLQNPSSTSMTVTWFSHRDESGTLTLTGPGLRGQRTYRSDPQPQDGLAYTAAERAEEIPGLPQGSWLLPDGNVKHVVQLEGLRPDTRYRYTVRQGRERASASLTTAPSADRWRTVRFVAMSDHETEPRGRVTRREWAPGTTTALPRPGTDAGGAWAQSFGTTTLLDGQVLRYPLTEDEGYAANLAVIERRQPDFLVFPGDLVQGGGYQPGWDEWFSRLAGPRGDLLTDTPVLPAFGNWESFGALNGGYGTPEDRSPVVRSRAKYHAYFDAPPNGTPQHTDSYYRIDYGPLTVLTLDANNGEPDDDTERYADDPATGTEYRGPGTDTQNNFTADEYEAAGGADLVDLSPGGAQWVWAEQQLADARAAGRVVVVQWHHSAYSSGEHGLPMYHEDSSGQGGTPMRQYHPLMERYGVAAVLSGHSELFERSFVDEDGDGTGVHYYDVGVAGDGLRGERRTEASLTAPYLGYNPYRAWTADRDEPEVWVEQDGAPVLVEGGKHYGHLEVELTRTRTGATMTLTPVHVFPLLSYSEQDGYEVDGTQRRTYGDVVELTLDRAGRVVR
ncbi:hypothetical protein GCM10028777_07000 [Angustibacter speluncae]